MNHKKQRGALLLEAAILIGVFFGIFIGIENAQKEDDIANRTPDEIIVSANNKYDSLNSFKDKNTYATPIYIEEFKYGLEKLDKEIIELKVKINEADVKKENWTEKVKDLDDRDQKLHQILNVQEKENNNK